jgi:hypothetical protein
MKEDLGDYSLGEFQSSEEMDLQNLTDEELWAWWNLWFQAAQSSNGDDEHIYSHGVLAVTPGHEELLDRYRHGV